MEDSNIGVKCIITAGHGQDFFRLAGMAPNGKPLAFDAHAQLNIRNYSFAETSLC
jgi:hypothetical protein